MKKYLLFSHFSLLMLLMLNLSSCGYSIVSSKGSGMQGTEIVAMRSDSTISIGTIDQASIYMDVSFETANIIRDEVMLRQLGTWANNGKGDYLINLSIPSFRISSFEDNNYEEVLISSIEIDLILSIVDSKNGEQIWTSDRIYFSDNYESPRQDTAIYEALEDTIQMAFEAYEGRF